MRAFINGSIAFSVVCLFTSLAQASPKPVTGTFNQKPTSGTKIVAIASNGKASSTSISSKSFTIRLPAASARLYLLKDGKVSGQIVLSKCKGSPSAPKKCSTTKVYTAFKAGANLGKLTKSGLAYVTKSTSLSAVVPASQASAVGYVPTGLSTLGLGTAGGVFSAAEVGVAADQSDIDSDGMLNAVDIDDDGDDVIDNYDSNNPVNPQNSFRIFSNLKLNIDESLNHYTTGLSNDRLLQALNQVQTLAIEVAGTTQETTELDCGSLSYCSTGGTGKSPPPNGNSFPGASGGAFDPDSDGFGTIERGGTGDFQLATHPSTATSVSAGDTLIQRVTDSSGSERQIPGVLNFVFSSTPGIKSFKVNSDPEQVLDYSAPPVLGALNNCVLVSATETVSVEIKGYRPQRPGVLATGEGDLMNIANSQLTIDIPNAPVSPGGGGGSRGPGNCTTGYSTSDTNLALQNGILRDALILDYPVVLGQDDANLYTFSIDVSACLAAANPPVEWSSGQALFLDLQFRSDDGDNAATKFCLIRN